LSFVKILTIVAIGLDVSLVVMADQLEGEEGGGPQEGQGESRRPVRDHQEYLKNYPPDLRGW
jgi:hypothetical protein